MSEEAEDLLGPKEDEVDSCDTQRSMLAVVTGVVHPMRRGWYFEEPVRFNVKDSKWMVVIRQSQFHVFVGGERPSDIATFLNEVESMVQGCLDSLGFHLAVALRAEILSMVIDGRELVYRADEWPELLPDPPINKVPAETLQPFISAAAEEPLIRLALADVRAAIESPDDTVMLCYRAIESVRQWFLKGNVDEGPARKQSWEDMRNTLNIGEAELRSLEQLALSRRHGGVAALSADERSNALSVARKVVGLLVAHRVSAAS